MTDQRTPEWFAQRAGKATASRISDIMAQTKSGPSASRKNYEAQLIAERLTGAVEMGYTNAAMQFGIDTEPRARAAYAFQNDTEVQEIGFVDHPTIAMAGASPDGLVGEDGLVEIKCPYTAQHIDMLLNGSVKSEYITQMQWQMACTGRQWCDFVSFDPRMPVELQLFVKRVVRDNHEIGALQAAVSVFLAQVDSKVSALRSLIDPATS